MPNVCQMSDASPPDPSTAAARASDPVAEDDPRHRRHLARSTAIFAAATGLSRVLGLVREMVAAYFFGVEGLINAFTVAFQIPNLIRALFADAALSGRSSRSSASCSGAIASGRGGSRRRSSGSSCSSSGRSTAVLILITPLLLRPFGDPGGDFDLAVTLARIMFPIVVLLGLTGVVVGILNAYDHFSIPALTPVAWNLVIILGLALGVPAVDSEETQLYIYAGSILVATFVQFLMPLPMLRGLDGRIRPVLEWRDPAVRRFFVLMLPVTITLGLINVNALIGTLFASRLIDPELAPAAIDKAFRLYMLPQGMFSVAVATVLFPTLSRLAARGDIPGFRRQIDEGLRLIGFLLIPASLVSAALAVAITRIVYQRGAFTAEDTQIVAQCLAAFSIGLVFNGWMLMLTRGFYALQSNWAPTARRARRRSASTCALDVGVLPRRRLGPAARDLDLERDRRSPPCSSCCAGARASTIRARRQARSCGSSCSRSSRPRAAWGVWRGLDEVLGRGCGRSDRLGRRRARCRHRRLPGACRSLPGA